MTSVHIGEYPVDLAWDGEGRLWYAAIHNVGYLNAGIDVIELGPTRELGETLEVVERNIAAGQQWHVATLSHEVRGSKTTTAVSVERRAA